VVSSWFSLYSTSTWRHSNTHKGLNPTLRAVKYQEDSIQATSIKVRAFPYDITVSAVYCPHKHNLKREQFQTFFQTQGPRFIARGDYNSKHIVWGSRLTTTKGRELLKVIQEQNYLYLSTGTPTYWPTDGNKIPDLLDFFVTKGNFFRIHRYSLQLRPYLGPFSNNSNYQHYNNNTKTYTTIT